MINRILTLALHTQLSYTEEQLMTEIVNNSMAPCLPKGDKQQARACLLWRFLATKSTRGTAVLREVNSERTPVTLEKHLQ